MIHRTKQVLCIFCALMLFCSGSLAGAEQVKAEDEARKIVSGMSLRDKVTQLFLMDFRRWMPLDGEEVIAKFVEDPHYKGEPVTAINPEIARMLGEYRFGGVILFSENLKNTAESVQLVRELQRAAVQKGGLPLFLGADQEGGNITRLGQGTCLPGNMAIGATGSTGYAYEAGEVTGRELNSIGLNINFSPVADVNDNP